MSLARLGVFGGSFDPVHLGHLHAARVARAARDLDRVSFVPARRSPFKQDRRTAPGAARAELLELALADEPDFVVDRRELSRPGPSYTVDTLREVAADFAGARLYLILGGDNLAGLPDWRDVDEVLDLAAPLVVRRGGPSDFDELPECASLRERLAPRRYDALRDGYLALPPFPCSSTELRERLASGASTDGLLDPRVAARIAELGLYADAAP